MITVQRHPETQFITHMLSVFPGRPDMQINGSSILLGAAYSLFTEGGTAGPPDHVRVVSDSGQDVQAFSGVIGREL